jgi:hypothetical protein
MLGEKERVLRSFTPKEVLLKLCLGQPSSVFHSKEAATGGDWSNCCVLNLASSRQKTAQMHPTFQVIKYNRAVLWTCQSAHPRVECAMREIRR